MFLGITPQVTNWSAAGDEFSLIFESNPLAEFVELPEERNNLWYSAILAGVIKGCLEMVSYYPKEHFQIQIYPVGKKLFKHCSKYQNFIYFSGLELKWNYGILCNESQ